VTASGGVVLGEAVSRFHRDGSVSKQLGDVFLDRYEPCLLIGHRKRSCLTPARRLALCRAPGIAFQIPIGQVTTARCLLSWNNCWLSFQGPVELLERRCYRRGWLWLGRLEILWGLRISIPILPRWTRNSLHYLLIGHRAHPIATALSAWVSYASF
jgi:hypothetical protein